MTLVELRNCLGEPTSGHELGDPLSPTPGVPSRKTASWSLESGLGRTQPLDEHIAALVGVFQARREAFDSLRDRCEIDIFCGVFSGEDAQGGFVLEPTLTGSLSDLRLPVVFDIY